MVIYCALPDCAARSALETATAERDALRAQVDALTKERDELWREREAHLRAALLEAKDAHSQIAGAIEELEAANGRPLDDRTEYDARMSAAALADDARLRGRWGWKE